MASCERCKSITLEKLLPGPHLFDTDNTNTDIQLSYLHHLSFNALRESAVKCELCKVIVHSLIQGDEYGGLKAEELEGKSSEISIRAGEVYESYPHLPKRVSQAVVDCGGRFTSILSIFTDEDDPAAISEDIAGLRLSSKADSSKNFETLNKWLKGCIMDHPECALTAGNAPDQEMNDCIVPLLTRVLDVGSSAFGRVSLLISEGLSAPYATLSHCWGSSGTMTTRKRTILQRKSGINMLELPKTFQDAVDITRKLGLRYLWIDSLCIVQDSLSDWQRESSKMGLYYRNSLFTIAATGAMNSSIGCFVPRASPALAPVRLNSSVGSGKPSYMYIGLGNWSYGDAILRSPLNKRAWVLQEQILSRRIFHFAAPQLFFECQRQCLAEDGSRYGYYSRVKQSFDLRDYLGSERDDINRFEYISHLPLFWRWCLIVQDYSKRDLTIPADKLPALSGLASEVKKRTGDRYLAGLWADGLHVALLWMGRYATSLRRPPGYRAPSWSWAAVDGDIAYGRIPLTLRSESAVSPFTSYVEPAGQDPNGRVQSGRLEFMGLVRPAIYAEELAFPENHPQIIGRKLLDTLGEYVGWGLLDFEVELPVDVLCLKIAVLQHDEGYGIMIVEYSEATESAYRRIGAGYIKGSGWFDKVQKSPVTLI